ncbi:MAG: dTDP-4-dehydrorhamnose reductase [Chloroflexi bacterium]|nr:MAG: dTDP-4-dehydrorhamnose reductase [Chloroflexota bacterium]
MDISKAWWKKILLILKLTGRRALKKCVNIGRSINFMRILITGAAGRLGGRLVDILRPSHDVISPTHNELDITDFPAVRDFIQAHQPDIVLHPAAWTDVDGCAKEPDKAIIINGYGTQNVAIASYEIGAAILYVSSNEVFDGGNNHPYREYDSPNPINPYGYSKYVGERAVLSLNPRHYIVRTSWLFAHGGKNFLQAILNAAELGKPLRVVTDEVANPTYNDDLAIAIAQLIEIGRYGIYHLVNEGAVSRYNFARYVLNHAGYTDIPIQPISSREWVRASRPPVYAELANTAARQIGITLRNWREAVNAFLEREGLDAG